MDLITVGLIVMAGWFSLIVMVVTLCKAAAQGDARPTYQPAPADGSKKFEPLALN